jgi:hypothetical protein
VSGGPRGSLHDDLKALRGFMPPASDRKSAYARDALRRIDAFVRRVCAAPVAPSPGAVDVAIIRSLIHDYQEQGGACVMRGSEAWEALERLVVARAVPNTVERDDYLDTLLGRHVPGPRPLAKNGPR